MIKRENLYRIMNGSSPAIECHYFYPSNICPRTSLFLFICHICLVNFATSIYVERTREEHVNNATVVEEMKTRKCQIFTNMFNSMSDRKNCVQLLSKSAWAREEGFQNMFSIK